MDGRTAVDIHANKTILVSQSPRTARKGLNLVIEKIGKNINLESSKIFL